MERRVRVVGRIRPLIDGDKSESCVTIQEDNKEKKTLQLQNSQLTGSDVYRFSFDGLYDNSLTQKQFYDTEIKPLIQNVFKGCNSTVFAYGITGSGKTYTMEGRSGKEEGVISRAVQYTLRSIRRIQFKAAKSSPDVEGNDAAMMSISYLQVYREKIYDLLSVEKKDLPIREDYSHRVIVTGLEEVQIENLKHFHDIFSKASRERKTASTKLNNISSRSHAILTLKVRCIDPKDQSKVLSGSLHLIDLAGSEDNRKTQNSGDRLAESKNINTSLFNLGKVISALKNGDSRIPYRDSKLTRLLQDSLGGSSATLMIANVSPSLFTFQETLNSLTYATKSRSIVNNVVPSRESFEHKETTTSQICMEEKLSRWRTENGVKPKLQKERTFGIQGKARRNTPSSASVPSTSKTDVKNFFHKMKEDLKSEMAEKQREMLSPLIRKTRLLNSETLGRLAQIEKGLMNVVTTDQISNMENEETFSVSERTSSSPAQVAKDMVLRANELKHRGELMESLHCYREASRLMPQSIKLKKKISDLKVKLARESCSKIEGDESSVLGKRRCVEEKENSVSVPSMKRMKIEDKEGNQESLKEVCSRTRQFFEAQVFDTLKSGTLKDLIGLKMIGQKRAEKILLHRDEITCLDDLSSVGVMSTNEVEKFRRMNVVEKVLT